MVGFIVIPQEARDAIEAERARQSAKSVKTLALEIRRERERDSLSRGRYSGSSLL
jgi:hypothetical protein